MNNVQESVLSWKLEETNFSAFFLLKILNRHWPNWTFGEDIRSVSHSFPWNPIQLKQPPIVDWISKEKGFSSKIYSVKLFPENGSDFQICVKIPSTFHLESSITASAENLTDDEIQIQKRNARRIIAQSHAREVDFYKFATQKFLPGFLKIPMFIYGREWTKDQEGILVMEDLTNFCQSDFLPRKPFCHNQTLALIEQICRLQISSVFHENLSKEFPVMENVVNCMSKYAILSCEILLDKELNFFNEETAKKILEFCRPSILTHFLGYSSSNLPPVLVHGSIWPGNVLWSKNDRSQLCAIVDWQGTFAGSPTADLAALLAISVTGEDRRNQEDEYIKYFVDTFNNLRENSPEKDQIPVYDFETIRESYGKSLLFSLVELIVVIVTNPLDDLPENDEILGPMSQRLKFLIEDVLE